MFLLLLNSIVIDCSSETYDNKTSVQNIQNSVVLMNGSQSKWYLGTFCMETT